MPHLKTGERCTDLTRLSSDSARVLPRIYNAAHEFIMTPIKDKRIAIFIEELFDDEEALGTSDRLLNAGAAVVFIGPTAPHNYTGLNGRVVTTDQSAGKTKLADIDAIVIPGGFAPGKMRMRHVMVDLVRDAIEAKKLVAAICHGPQMLISANAVRDRMITCWPSIAIDVKNAGGLYMDRQVIEDHNIITSRKIDDVEAFSNAIIKTLATSSGPQ